MTIAISLVMTAGCWAADSAAYANGAYTATDRYGQQSASGDKR